MAIAKVSINDADGNIGSVATTNRAEQISGMLFDISAQGAAFWTTGSGKDLSAKLKDKVLLINSTDDLKDLTGFDKFLGGVPDYHIRKFLSFTSGYNKQLYVLFADCSKDWDGLVNLQKAAQGNIGQIGVWTEQKLWKQTSESAETYALQLVSSINEKAVELAGVYHAPCNVILNANTSVVEGAADKTITLTKIPTAVVESRYVTVALGQEATDDIQKMQASLTSTTPVGNMGAALAMLNRVNVATSIGYVAGCNLASQLSKDIEFGFGDATVEAGANKIKNSTPHESMKMSDLDTLDNKGYIFLHKYVGYDGVFFSKDYTCSKGDYNTIARNRAINKANRLVRQALLPFVNAPLYLTNGGTLSVGARTEFINTITSVLKAMQAAGEISAAGTVSFDATTNLLRTKTLLFKYAFIPVGCSEQITVTQGLAVSV